MLDPMLSHLFPWGVRGREEVQGALQWALDQAREQHVRAAEAASRGEVVDR